ncbi:trimethylguanosine synthase-like [Leguminivora glycinivorella]|uniref:trimethylguanosine synthase-like n=1 Tax=Leguminivora glycinivorella TaxID=1035111 RepID=UPI00200CB17F|nr:trimethylguanosine synthase-like [Leguminivora glycinivorella]
MPKQRPNPSLEVNKKKLGRQRQRQPKKKRIAAMRNTVKLYEPVQVPPECAWRMALVQISGATMQPKKSRRRRKYLNTKNQVQLVDQSAVEDTLADFEDWPTDDLGVCQQPASLETVEQKITELQLNNPKASQLKGVNTKKANKQRQKQRKNNRTNKAIQQAQLQILLEHELLGQTSTYGALVNNSNTSQTSNISRPKDFALMPPELQEDPNMWKYWKKRLYLFSRYPEGIKLDKESWYSVTPEPIARMIAERRHYDCIMDAFCGAGGNTIQFAKTCGQKVLAIDIDPNKIELARHNSRVYGVEDRIQFFVGDFFELAKMAPHFLKANMIFLSPPWGGPNYVKDGLFDIETLEPRPASELVREARKISSSVTLYLPRNSNRDQIQSLADENDIVEIKEMMGGSKGQGKSFQALVVYYTFCDYSIPTPADGSLVFVTNPCQSKISSSKLGD